MKVLFIAVFFTASISRQKLSAANAMKKVILLPKQTFKHSPSKFVDQLTNHIIWNGIVGNAWCRKRHLRR